jgi:hypothetical protein
MAIAGLFFYLSDDVVKYASWTDSIGEIATVGLFVFLFLFVVYIIAKGVARGAGAITKKKPSGEEGLKR